MERATLLRMLHENRAFFDQTVALVSDERMCEPPREGHWSGKDILAHVTTWERRLLGWLAAAARGAGTQIPEPGATWDDMDRLNAVSYAANRDRALEDITADSRRSFAQVLAQIEAFSDGRPERSDALPLARPSATLAAHRRGARLWPLSGAPVRPVGAHRSGAAFRARARSARRLCRPLHRPRGRHGHVHGGRRLPGGAALLGAGRARVRGAGRPEVRLP